MFTFFNQKKNIYIFFALFCLYGFVLWYATFYYGLPNGDEAVYANLVINYIKTGKLFSNSSPFLREYWQQTQQENLLFGNIYTIAGAWCCEALGGFSQTNYRLFITFTNILSLFCIWQLLSFQNYLALPFRCLLLLFYVIDSCFFKSLMQFRPEALALSFVIGATWAVLHLKADNKKSNKTTYVSRLKDLKSILLPTFRAAMVGLFMVLAVLTTPKAVVLLLSLGLLLLLRAYREPTQRLPLFVIGIVIMLGYGTWISTKFGSMADFYQYYIEAMQLAAILKKEQTTLFIWYKFNIETLHQFTFLLGFICLLLNYKKILKGWQTDELFFVAALNFISYYVIVHTASNSLYALVWTLLLIVKTLQDQQTFLKPYLQKIEWATMAYALLLFCLVPVYSATKLYLFAEGKNSTAVYAAFAKLPKGTKIVGDNMYFYACHQNQLDFEQATLILSHSKAVQANIDTTATFQKLLALHKKADYLVLSEEGEQARGINKQLRNFYLRNLNLTLLDTIKMSESPTNWFATLLMNFYKTLNLTVPPTYNGRIYEIKK